MSYYKNFRIVIGTPLWRLYLRWVYKQGLSDFKKFNYNPNFSQDNFTCLLCGVGNEVTADEFIKFVLEKNKQAKIWIIDLGKEQIEAVKNLVQGKYSDANISVKKINALDLKTIIKPHTIDWIETDGLFEFFDKDSLKQLLIVWKGLIAKNGFITTRACSTENFWDRLLDQIKVWGGKNWLNVEVYSHTRKCLYDIFHSLEFKFTERSTALSIYKRYSILNS